MRKYVPAFFMLLPLLVGCNSGMMAVAPSIGMGAQKLQSPAIPVHIIAVEAGMPEVSARYAGVLAQEAQARGYVVNAANAGNQPIRLKAYLTAYGAENGQTAYSWVLDTSEDGQTRKSRVSGQSLVAASSSGGVTALDEGTMRKVAGASLDALTLQLTNPEAASAARIALEE